MDYNVVLEYGELGQRDYNGFNNKVVYLKNVSYEEAEAFASKFNKGLGPDFKPYCPMRYTVVQGIVHGRK